MEEKEPPKVEIAHQIMLGVRIAVGMFIVFPVFVVLILIVLAMFGRGI